MTTAQTIVDYYNSNYARLSKPHVKMKTFKPTTNGNACQLVGRSSPNYTITVPFPLNQTDMKIGYLFDYA